MTRVLVCGGRHYLDRMHVFRELEALDPAPTLIIQGGASGVDSYAMQWSQRMAIPCICYWADWAKLGKRAGPVRNQKMLDCFKPDLVVAFPGGTGTADMVRRAKAANVRVLEARQ